MQRKERRHKCTPPGCGGDGIQQQQQQHSIGAVEQDIFQMHRARIQPEHLAVGHVRKPRQRMPVAGVLIRKRPHETRPGQPGANDHIVGNVIVVVVINKTVMARGPIDRERDAGQQQAGQPGPPVGFNSSHGSILEQERIFSKDICGVDLISACQLPSEPFNHRAAQLADAHAGHEMVGQWNFRHLRTRRSRSLQPVQILRAT